MYGFDELRRDLECWQSAGAEVGVIGRSVLGRELYFVRIGDTRTARAIVTAGIHAREHIASLVVAEQIYHTLAHADELRIGTIYLPMCDPDGVELCLHGVGSVRGRPATARLLRSLNGGKTDFSLWKANARGVDLNVNFPARWGTGAQNVFRPGPSDYAGPYPLSEPETEAMAAFLHRARPCYTVSYHAKGEVIYWDFGQTDGRERDRAFAQAAAAVTGYRVVDGTGGSAGGYKDYCVAALAIPALTIEVAEDAYSHPIPYAAVKNAVGKTKTLGIALSEAYKRLRGPGG